VRDGFRMISTPRQGVRTIAVRGIDDLLHDWLNWGLYGQRLFPRNHLPPRYSRDGSFFGNKGHAAARGPRHGTDHVATPCRKRCSTLFAKRQSSQAIRRISAHLRSSSSREGLGWSSSAIDLAGLYRKAGLADVNNRCCPRRRGPSYATRHRARTFHRRGRWHVVSKGYTATCSHPGRGTNPVGQWGCSWTVRTRYGGRFWALAGSPEIGLPVSTAMARGGRRILALRLIRVLYDSDRQGKDASNGVPL